MRRASAWHLYRNYLFLVPLFLCVLMNQAVDLYATVRSCIPSRPMPQQFLANDGHTITNLLTGKVSALHAGDRLLAINGIPFTSEHILLNQLQSAKPGTSVLLTIAGRNGAARTVSVPVPFIKPSDVSVWEAVVRITLEVMLTCCALIGIYVAAVLPFDARALIVFGLMVSTSRIIGTHAWLDVPRPLFTFAFLYPTIAVATWGLWFVLFALYFPHRFGWHARSRWIKWLFIGPIALWAAAAVLGAVHSQLYFNQFGWVRAPDGRIMAALCIGFFFTCLGVKTGMSKGDSRRRLQILFAGSAIGLAPVGLLLLATSLSGMPPSGELFAVIFVVVAFLFLVFPASLAYAVLADRAMNVRMVIRQSVRYAFAKGILRLAFSVVFGFAVLGAIRLFGRSLNGPGAIAIFALAFFIMNRLVRPFRDRLQRWVDRRFFREAYNAERVLEELSDTVVTIVQRDELLNTVTRRIADTLHVRNIAVLLHDAGTFRPVCTVGTDGHVPEEIPASSQTVKVLSESKQPAPVYFDRRDSWVHNIPKAELLTLKQINAQLLAPVGLKDKLLGIVSLGPKLSEEPYSPTDVHLLKSVMTQTALALENSRLASEIANEVAERERINREIEIAREVQERLFPQHLPVIAGIDYCGACRPARGVAGDYYDFLQLANGDMGIAIGDVSGKGIAAALLMASLQACLRGQVMANQGDLARLMSNVNQLVYEASSPNRYATFFYGQYTQATRLFRYVNAGHNAPVVLRRAGGGSIHIIRLDTGGPVVGLFPNLPYQEGSLILQPADIFVGFTDGISEAMNQAEEEWGETRLIPAIAANAEKPAADLLPALMKEADTFVAGAPQHDDMTLIVMKIAA